MEVSPGNGNTLDTPLREHTPPIMLHKVWLYNFAGTEVIGIKLQTSLMSIILNLRVRNTRD